MTSKMATQDEMSGAAKRGRAMIFCWKVLLVVFYLGAALSLFLRLL